MSHWVIFAYGGYGRMEFGIDYRSLEAARRAKARYAAHFPTARYLIRRRRGPALAVNASSN